MAAGSLEEAESGVFPTSIMDDVRLVRIIGMSSPLQPTPMMLEFDPDMQSPIGVEGLVGWSIGVAESFDRRLILTFSGRVLSIETSHLQEYEPAPVVDGGSFDVAWPPEGGDAMLFAEAVARKVASQGFCVIQTTSTSAASEAAMRWAENQKQWACMVPEVERLIMGRNAQGKILFLDEEAAEDPSEDAAVVFEAEAAVTSLSELLAPFADMLGFAVNGHSTTMLRMAFGSPQEEERLRDEAADSIVVGREMQDFENFVKRRRIGVISFLQDGGGTCVLHPKATAIERELRVERGRLLLFSCDAFDFSYQPGSSRELVLQSYLLRAGLPAEEKESRTAERQLDLAMMSKDDVPTAPCDESGETVDCMSLAVVMPGSVHSPDDYWQLLTIGGDGVIRVPPNRWDHDLYFDPQAGIGSSKMYLQHYGMLPNEYELFDHEFFDIPAAQAAQMDPPARMSIEVAYEALMRAGWTRKTLVGTEMVSSMGNSGTDWAGMSAAGLWDLPADPYKCLYVSRAEVIDRVSYQLGIRGPTYILDTACSSSLTATAMTHSVMRPTEWNQLKHSNSRQVQAGLVMGANGLFEPGYSIALCSAGMLTHQGRCFTFDQSADGFGRSEGVSAMHYLVHRNDAPSRLSVLCGTCMNQDGRSASLTAPHGPSQQECIRASLKEAGIRAFDIQIQELHGTGTALGDPIEVGALRATMMKDGSVKRSHPLVKTSSKSNVAHMESNAGIGGIMKCTLMACFGVASPGIHLRLLNPHIDYNGYPVLFNPDLVDQGKSWGYLGVSSFGFGGSNARGDIWGLVTAGVRKALPIGMDFTYNRHLMFNADLQATANMHVMSEREHESQLPKTFNNGSVQFTVGTNPFESGSKFCLAGSWNGWSSMDPFVDDGSGVYRCGFRMGDMLREEFRIHVDYYSNSTISPAEKQAGPDALILGPGTAPKGHHWRVDGLKDGARHGTVYVVKFWWDEEARQKRVSWEIASPEDEAKLAIKEYVHRYYIKATWTTWALQEVLPVLGLDYLYETTMRIGLEGVEEFQFVRDADPDQVIYPGISTASKTSVPVRGPDAKGKGKHWLVRGETGKSATIRLRIRDGSISVTVKCGQANAWTWKSLEDPDMGTYFLHCSWSTNPLPMVAAARSDGKRWVAKMTTRAAPEANWFQIHVDEDPSQAIYPELPGAAQSGVSAAVGPDELGQDSCWQIVADPGTVIQIVLDLSEKDRRRTVTWEPVGTLALTAPRA